jgi:hypothetical protein
MKKQKENLTTLEIFGAEALLNISLKNNIDEEHPNEELFYCGGVMHSASDTNGYPIDIEGFALSHCIVLENGCLVAICYDEEEERKAFLIEENGIYETKL